MRISSRLRTRVKRIHGAAVCIFLVACGTRRPNSTPGPEGSAVRPVHEEVRRETPDAVAAPTPRLEGGADSLEALAKRALEALERRDAAALHALRVDAREYREVVWPELPQSKPPHTLTVDFHWGLLDTNSLKGMRNALRDFGGQHLELLEVFPEQGVEDHRTFQALRKVALKVKSPAGEVAVLRVLGSVIVQEGRYKLLSFRE